MDISAYTLRYGHGEVTFTVPQSVAADTIMYRRGHAEPSREIIRQAVEFPVGAPRLKVVAEGKRNAAIIISDATRLNPSSLFLPDLIDELNAAGIPDRRIRVIVALGAHRKQTEAELQTLAGQEVYNRVTVQNHSAQSADCTLLGVTSRGTPVEINQHVVQADIRILTGNIEPHRLAGMSGGIKALMPGVASLKSIEHNHSLSVRYPAEIGRIDNSVHEDMMEVLRFLPVHFIFNSVADHDKQLLYAAAGELGQVHQALRQKAKEMFIVDATAQYDFIIASPGGYPKDAQLYQAVKSLQNAAAIAKPGGVILLIARCEELFGNGTFQTWIETVRDHRQMVRMLQEEFRLGAHKVKHIAEIIERCRVLLYSDMPPALVELCGFLPVTDLQETITRFSRNSGRIAVMPFAALTFPR